MTSLTVNMTFSDNTTYNSSLNGLADPYDLPKDLLLAMVEEEMYSNYFLPWVKVVLIVFYSVFITFGAVGNGLVIFVVSVCLSASDPAENCHLNVKKLPKT